MHEEEGCGRGLVGVGGSGEVGGGMTEGQVERRLLSLTQHLSHFITKSSMTNSAGARQKVRRAGIRGEREG